MLLRVLALVVAALDLAAIETGARAQDPAANAMWLEDLDLSKMGLRGRWKPGRRTSTGGHPLRIAGVTYPHGVGTHAWSFLVVDLKAAATRFTALVGPDDEPATEYGTPSVAFEVWVDDALVLETGVLRAGQKLPVSVDLTGAHRLELVANDGGDGSNGDHADWAGAQLALAPGATARPEAIVPAPEPAAAIAPFERDAVGVHAPRLVGTSPGRPFLWRIPASGRAPLRFAARGLPKGLSLDATTGIVTGSVAAAGRHDVDVTVVAANGRATGRITIVAERGALARTPPLGWSSWNAVGEHLNGDVVRRTADALVRTGLAARGYDHVNIDDGWAIGRAADGTIQPDPRMGDMRALGDYVHARGLRFGIYSSPGAKTCGGRPGSLGHEASDARSWASWGVDYLKHDWCSYAELVKDERDREALVRPFRAMRAALDAADRDVTFALCQYGIGQVWNWGPADDVRAQLWRTTGDLVDTWASVRDIGWQQGRLTPFAGPGRWNDPDMLVVGKTGGWANESRPSRLSGNEQILHVTHWSLLAAPLILGCDLDALDPFTLALVGNDEVIAVDTDALGVPATLRRRDGRREVWARPLADGSIAVGLYNLGWRSTEVGVRWSDLGIAGVGRVRDLWQRRELRGAADGISVAVPQHGAVLLKVTPPRR